MKQLLVNKPYSSERLVEKIECRNHLLRNLSSKLRAIWSNTCFPVALRKHLEANLFLYALVPKQQYMLLLVCLNLRNSKCPVSLFEFFPRLIVGVFTGWGFTGWAGNPSPTLLLYPGLGPAATSLGSLPSGGSTDTFINLNSNNFERFLISINYLLRTFTNIFSINFP